MARTPVTLAEHLARAYPFTVHADRDGGYVVVFPDLPGCITQVDTLDDLGPMAEEARHLWIESEYERGNAIPDPPAPDDPSGRFVIRIPRSLHRSLAAGAARDRVSLNQYVCTILARGDVLTRVETRLDALGAPGARVSSTGHTATG